MTRVSEEYATALFALASEENVRCEVAESAEIIRSLILENPDYIELLAAPNIPIDERCTIIDEALGSLHEYAVSFVKLMCERGHIRDLMDCLEEYLRLYEYADGVVTAEITSAVALSEAELAALKAKLEAKLARRVETVLSVDESLLGGVIIRVDGNVIDGSLRRKLAEVKDAISS